jgi:D-inositol-3-phosphate glycosyltransferase
MSKYRLLFWGDSPTTATGFGQVSKNILKMLYDTNKYDINIVGINHTGMSYDYIKFPYRIDPATCLLTQDTDVYGRSMILKKLQTEQVDILFILNDTFLIQTVMKDILKIRDQLPKERKFVIVYYYPIDGTPKKEWIEEVVCKVDFPVTYTEFAKQECYKALGKEFPLEIINHGTNKNVFHTLNEEEVNQFKCQNFGKTLEIPFDHSKDFFILNVNRNQPRKDLYRSLAAFKIFHDKVPNSFYFLNCQCNDVGGNIHEIAQNVGLEVYKDFSYPATNIFDANQGLPIEVVNMFYNVADLVISSTIGEGWGLSSTEAMATKTPILFPKNTSLVEIIGENEERGYFCRSGGNYDHMVCLGMPDNNILRPIVDIQDMADRMLYIYEHYDEAKAKAEVAYQWVKSWSDKSIKGKWLETFRLAETKLNEIRGE